MYDLWILIILMFYVGLGIMATGAINVVRGSRSSVEELLQIYDHSERCGQSTFLLACSAYSSQFPPPLLY